jgi:hypothetical protein
MEVGFYRQWVAEGAYVNLDSPDMHYILNPIVPTTDTLYDYRHPKAESKGGKKLAMLPIVEQNGMVNYFSTANVDTALAKSKGLLDDNGEPNQTYLRLEAVYRAAFNAFLDKEGALSRIDQQVADSKLPYYPVSAEGTNVYRKYCSFGRMYVCLKNDFYIEKLDEGDLSLLYHPTKDNLQDIMNMVRRTYQEVIATPSIHDPTGAGEPIQQYETSTNAVTLSITCRYDTGRWSDESDEAITKWIRYQASSLQECLSQQLGYPVSVLPDDIGQYEQ